MEYKELSVSTKTFIVLTNVQYNLKKIVEYLPITDYVIVEKKRGRKKKNAIPPAHNNIEVGGIISLKYKDILRGINFKKNKKNVFRNSLSVVMSLGIIDGVLKLINFKICENGKLQITGCKVDEHAELATKYFWEYIENNPELYIKKDDEDFSMIFIPAMRNISFKLDINIDREKLNTMFNELGYKSLYEPSVGYTGVNIKIPVNVDLSKIILKKILKTDDKWIVNENVNYADYLLTVSEVERKKKYEQERFNTFFVFQSGKVLMSSMCEFFAVKGYDSFMKIMNEKQDEFIEKLDL